MTTKQIVSILEHMARLLVLTGANPFKSRAFENGARIVEALDEDLAELVEEGRLQEIDGVGKGLTAALTELVREGRFSDYEELKASIPDGLHEVLRIPGLGPKKVRFLWKEADVKSIDELEAAAKDGKLRGHAGFGPKTESNILRGIEQRRQATGRVLWLTARGVAAGFEQALRDDPRVKRLEVAGSLRRRSETVHDVDLVAAVDEEEREAVMESFATSPSVNRVVARGPTKTSILTDDDVQVDLRIVGVDEFPFALHHFTGSKEHNTAMRGRAKKMGLTMSEWGVFRDGEEDSLPAADEEEVFGLLGLPWIPPEIREDQGEIEAAEEDRLPALLTAADLRGALHVHTTASDGRASLREVVEAARELGWKYLGISDHSVSAVYANGLSAERLREQGEEIVELQKEFRGLRILCGIESDILEDGTLDYDDDVLASLDFVIASVHSRLTMDVERMTERILTAMRHPAVTILGHPTGRRLLAREAYAVDLERVIVEAGRTGVALELNAHPRRLDLDWRLHRRAVREKVTISIGPDAHARDDLAFVELGVGAARKGWLTKKDVLNSWTPRQLTAFLARRRKSWKPEPGVRSRYDENGEPLT